MDAHLAALIEGTLTSASLDLDDLRTVTIVNQLPIPLAASLIFSEGAQSVPVYVVDGNSARNWQNCPNNIYLLLTEPITGALVAAVFCGTEAAVPAEISITVGSDMLTAAGDLGEPPLPDAAMILPPDPPEVVVGCGIVYTPPHQQIPNYVVRSQHWRKTDASYSLPPNDSRTVAVVTSSGMQSTSSSSETVAASISATAGGGWGPVSASVSASLSISSTSSSSYTVEEAKTRLETLTLRNEGSETALYLAWQLSDTVTAVGWASASGWAGLVPAATVGHSRPPVLYYGPYSAADLPPAPAAPSRRFTAAEQAYLSQYWIPVPPPGG